MAPRTRIMLAVRIGDASAGPGRTAAWLASSLDAHITLLYVAVELRTANQIAVATGMSVEEVREQMVREAKENAEAWAGVALEGVSFDVVVAEGEVAERVAAVASEIGADLVVVGTEARGAIRGMILGDTTREILRQSHTPVVVVPPGAEEQ